MDLKVAPETQKPLKCPETEGVPKVMALEPFWCFSETFHSVCFAPGLLPCFREFPERISCWVCYFSDRWFQGI